MKYTKQTMLSTIGWLFKIAAKIREIQPPRKSTSVAYFFDNVYNRNVRDVDKYLHVTVSINIYIVFVVAKYMHGSVMTM